MLREKLIIVCTCEIAGRVRGKGFPASELASRLVSGVGWVPTNTMISALGVIGDTPFGATGDLILVPDATTEAHVDFEMAARPSIFSSVTSATPTARPWECCPREFLRRGLAALKEAAGARALRQLRARVRLYRRRGHAWRALQPRRLAAAGHLRRGAGRGDPQGRAWSRTHSCRNTPGAAVRGDGRAEHRDARRRTMP